MYIKTSRLIIRLFTENDADALYNIKYDPAVIKYNPDFLKRDIKKEQIPDIISNYNSANKEKPLRSKTLYAIALRENDEVIGAISFQRNCMLHEYELGWKVMTPFTRKGYASEAAAACADAVCEERGIDYLIVVMDTDNPASYRTAEKSGFRLFEKRKVYDYSYENFGDDYYYFRRYSSTCTAKEKFYGDTAYTGRGLYEEDERIYPELIMLRGNSGSGKTTVAKSLQKKLGRGTMYIPQDVARREMLWVHDHSGNKAIDLLRELLRFGYQNSRCTIIEGGLYSEDYGDVFRTARELFGQHIHAYYFDTPFEETVARHRTKPNCDEFGEEEMREWYVEKNYCNAIPEETISENETAESVVERILNALRISENVKE